MLEDPRVVADLANWMTRAVEGPVAYPGLDPCLDGVTAAGVRLVERYPSVYLRPTGARRGKQITVIRLLLEMHLEREPRPEEVPRHRCDRRCCINPAHILPGLHWDNWYDAVERGRYILPTWHPLYRPPA